MRRLKSIRVCCLVSLLLQGGALFSCNSTARPEASRVTPSADLLRVLPLSSVTPPTNSRSNIVGDVIWTGTIDGGRVRWTSTDLYIESTAGIERVWEPLVRNGFDDFVAVMKSDPNDQINVEHCLYERSFELMSVVGSTVSFEDQYNDDCGGAHPSADTRFTAFDLAKPGSVFYSRKDETPMMDTDLAKPGRIQKLTDYFAEQDILRALLADRVIKRALSDRGRSKPPKTLADLPELFADDDYGLGIVDFELRPDYLTRFVFHHIEGNKVAVRLGLPPHSGANSSQHLQIGLLLPVPKVLKNALELAASRRQGFLMIDAAKISRNQKTVFRFRT